MILPFVKSYVDNSNFTLSPGKILIYRSGSTPPSYLSHGSIPSEIEKEEEKLLEELNALAE